ncbi:MAG: ferredoxin [Actinomycetota bacterium]|nr:MAG: ferredoxin [Actinomycetota bacterium]
MDVVVVGGGLAAASAVQTLRSQGFDGRVTLVGEEPVPPYERPPLSKEYLRGEATEPAWVRPATWYEEQGVELRLGVRVAEVLPADRAVRLEGGERLGYDRLLVATGVRNRRLEVPGADLPGIHDLRTLADADRLREAARGASSAVIVGAGFIGCEVAASFRQLGLEVTVVEAFPTPLYRVLGPELGRVIEAMHRDHGVRFLLGEGVARFEGTGRAEAVVTEGGRRAEGDLVVVGVGTRADAPAGVADERGAVPVGADLAAEVEGVYAAGDVADHDHPIFGRIRVEHYDNAIKMGETAARNLLGAGEIFDDPHWFWSDQYDSQLQVAGVATAWDRMVVRGSLEERRFAAFLLQDGVLRSTVTLDRKFDARRSLPLIRAQARPDPELLADPEVDLRTLQA